MKNFLMLFALQFSLNAVLAQTKDITGTVVNEKGEAVAGASVKVKATSSAALTDDNGSFSLKGIADTATLVITAGGYQDVEINTLDKTSISITLIRSAAAYKTALKNTPVLINFMPSACLTLDKERLLEITR